MDCWDRCQSRSSSGVSHGARRCAAESTRADRKRQVRFLQRLVINLKYRELSSRSRACFLSHFRQRGSRSALIPGRAVFCGLVRNLLRSVTRPHRYKGHDVLLV